MKEIDVLVERWGDSLAVRLPADLVCELGLREGDHVELRADVSGIAMRRSPRSEEVLASLRRFRGRLPAAERLSREDAQSR
jgi:antitoxin MazE